MMTQITTTETAGTFNYQQALRAISNAKAAYEAAVLEGANMAAEDIIAQDGVTYNLGSFTLAMFGYDDSAEGPVNETVRQFLDAQHRAYINRYSLPIAQFNKQPDRPRLKRIGFLHNNGLPSSLQFNVSKNSLSGGYVGEVALEVCGVLSWLEDGKELPADNIVIVEKSMALPLASARRLPNQLAEGLRQESLMAIGLKAIYETQQLGADCSNDGIYEDNRFLQLMNEATNGIGCTHND